MQYNLLHLIKLFTRAVQISRVWSPPIPSAHRSHSSLY